MIVPKDKTVKTVKLSKYDDYKFKLRKNYKRSWVPNLIFHIILILGSTKSCRHLLDAVTTISEVSNFFLDNSPKLLQLLDMIFKVHL